MRKILIAIIFLEGLTGLHAQKYEIGFTAGYSSFSMKDLKSDLENTVEYAPFEVKIVSNFPSWISFGGYLLRRFKVGYSIGVEYNFNSTGSRISSIDYSGKYNFDELLNSHSFGLVNSFRFLTMDKFQAEVRLIVGYQYSLIKTNEVLQVLDTTMSNSSSFYSDSFYLEPGVLVSYSFPIMRIGADLAYFIDKKGEIMTNAGKKTLNYTNWSGLRIGINIGLFPEELLKKKKKEK
jgi:hypothetical protein